MGDRADLPHKSRVDACMQDFGRDIPQDFSDKTLNHEVVLERDFQLSPSTLSGGLFSIDPLV